MDRYDDAIQLVGKDVVDDWLAPSGSVHGIDVLYFQGITGSFADPYRYPVLEKEIADDLWKCESCRKVYKLSEHLECAGCGTSITEKSRFVLE